MPLPRHAPCCLVVVTVNRSLVLSCRVCVQQSLYEMSPRLSQPGDSWCYARRETRSSHARSSSIRGSERVEKQEFLNERCLSIRVDELLTIYENLRLIFAIFLITFLLFFFFFISKTCARSREFSILLFLRGWIRK